MMLLTSAWIQKCRAFLLWLALRVYVILYFWYVLSSHRWDPIGSHLKQWWNKWSPTILTKTGRNGAEMSCVVAVACTVAYTGFCYFSKTKQKKYLYLTYIYKDNIFWTKTLNIWTYKIFLCVIDNFTDVKPYMAKRNYINKHSIYDLLKK